ncbi:MAG: SufE family protein [Candidatus Woesearchaeota archaeon]
MQMPAVFSELIEAFEALPDRRSRLEYLIEYGEELEYDGSVANEEHKVPGCVSAAYITGSVSDGRMVYRGWADSLIVRGFVRVLCEGLSGHSPREIIEGSRVFVEDLSSRTAVSSMVESRANTFASLYGRMRRIAEAAL